MGTLLWLVLIGPLSVVAAPGILFLYVVCEAISRGVSSRLPLFWWSGSRRYGLAVAMVLLLFPLMNYMLLFGSYRGFDPPRLMEHALLEVNAAGLRGPPLTPERRPRLLFLGDSTTFGYPYRYAESYPAQVRQLLREDGLEGVQILNAGLPGQNLLHLEQRLDELLTYEPDAVFLMAGVHYVRISTEEKEPSDAETSLWFLSFMPPAGLLLFSGWVSVIADWDDYVPARLPVYRRALDSLVARVIATGKPLVILEYPSPQVPSDASNLLCGAAGRDGVTWLALADHITGQEDLPDDIHPTVPVHRRFAESIVELIRTDPGFESVRRPSAGSRRWPPRRRVLCSLPRAWAPAAARRASIGRHGQRLLVD